MCSLVGLRGGRRARRTNFNTTSSWVMIKEKELNKPQTLIIQILTKILNLQLPQQKIRLQHFPRFSLVESKEDNRQITSLSPFLIQKIIQSIAGEPENIKKTTQIESATH